MGFELFSVTDFRFWGMVPEELSTGRAILSETSKCDGSIFHDGCHGEIRSNRHRIRCISQTAPVKREQIKLPRVVQDRSLARALCALPSVYNDLEAWEFLGCQVIDLVKLHELPCGRKLVVFRHRGGGGKGKMTDRLSKRHGIPSR